MLIYRLFEQGILPRNVMTNCEFVIWIWNSVFVTFSAILQLRYDQPVVTGEVNWSTRRKLLPNPKSSATWWDQNRSSGERWLAVSGNLKSRATWWDQNPISSGERRIAVSGNLKSPATWWDQKPSSGKRRLAVSGNTLDHTAKRAGLDVSLST